MKGASGLEGQFLGLGNRLDLGFGNCARSWCRIGFMQRGVKKGETAFCSYSTISTPPCHYALQAPV